MAKIILGATIGDARNKAGAIVYSRNRYGAYVRALVTPVNNQTDPQTTVRSSFATIAATWGTLTQSQMNAWEALAWTHPRKDIFGNRQTLNGQQLYCSLNQNLNLAGLTLTPDPPPTLAIVQPSPFTFTVTKFILTAPLTFTLSQLPPNTYAAIFWGTNDLSPGVHFIKNKLQIGARVAPPVTSPLTFTAPYAWARSVGTVGNVVWAALQFIAPTGVASRTVQTNATVT
jgi:hypothetical protein